MIEFHHKHMHLQQEFQKCLKIFNLTDELDRLNSFKLSGLSSGIRKLEHLEEINEKNKVLLKELEKIIYSPLISKDKVFGNKAYYQIIEEEIVEISLKGSRLRDFPTVLEDFEFLIKMDLSNNKITDILSLEKLKKLSALNLSRNDFENIPLTIMNLKRLKNLDLSENKIKKIPEILESKFTFDNGITLNLSNNNISSLPKNLVFFRNVQNIDLSNNQIKELPQEFRFLHFKTFNLRNNPLNKKSKKIIKELNSIFKKSKLNQKITF